MPMLIARVWELTTSKFRSIIQSVLSILQQGWGDADGECFRSCICSKLKKEGLKQMVNAIPSWKCGMQVVSLYVLPILIRKDDDWTGVKQATWYGKSWTMSSVISWFQMWSDILRKGVSEPVLQRAFEYWHNIDKDIGERIKKGVVSLKEKTLLDCSKKRLNFGCRIRTYDQRINSPLLYH